MTPEMSTEWMMEYTLGKMLEVMPKYHLGYSRQDIHRFTMINLGKLPEYLRYVQLCSIPMEQYTPQDHAIYEVVKNTVPLWTHVYDNQFIMKCIRTLKQHAQDSYITYVILHDVIENEVKHMSTDRTANLAMLELLKFMIGKPRV